MVFPSSVQYPTYLPLLMSATKLSRLSIVFSDTWHSFCTADASESVQIQMYICLAIDLAPPTWIALKESVRPFSLQNWRTILITL